MKKSKSRAAFENIQEYASKQLIHIAVWLRATGKAFLPTESLLTFLEAEGFSAPWNHEELRVDVRQLFPLGGQCRMTERRSVLCLTVWGSSEKEHIQG